MSTRPGPGSQGPRGFALFGGGDALLGLGLGDRGLGGTVLPTPRRSKSTVTPDGYTGIPLDTARALKVPVGNGPRIRAHPL